MDLFLILLLIFLVAFVPRFLVACRVDMTWDEGTYAFCGVTALKNIAMHNFSSDAWSFEFHPPIVMYLFGIAYATYVSLRIMIKRGVALDSSSLYQDGLRLFAGRRALLVVRLPSVILGSLSCVLAYLLCLDLFKNEAIGITAAIFLALTPSFIAWSSFAMLESGVTFFYLITIWTLLRAIEYSSVSYAIISGIFLGLAFGSKETGFGVPLVVLPWATSLLLRAYTIRSLNAVIGEFQLFLLWLIIGFITFYIMWPWLWKNPIRQFMKSLRATLSTLTSWEGASWSFYISDLLATTPIPLAFLYGIGLLESAFIVVNQSGSILLLSWALLPLILMSIPFTPKRGGAYEVIFILPPLSILAGLAAYKVSESTATVLEKAFTYTTTFSFDFYNVALLLVSFVLMGLIAFECVGAHPHYVDYYNPIAKSLSKKCRVGWWGEGMGDAIAYIDQNAPPNTTIWIYGPKSTAFYHSSRVDLEKSMIGEPLFYHRAKVGFNVPVEPSFYAWRKGDLKFYFPYYYLYTQNVKQLKSVHVSYIIVYRWATYDLTPKSWVDPENYKIISKLKDHHKPVFTAKIKNIEVCWVYKIDPYFKQQVDL